MVVTVQAESNMNEAHIQLLNQRYAEACEDYLKAFCEAYELPYEKDSWVGNEVGTIAMVGDHYFDFNDVIKYAVDNQLKDYEELLEWEDYVLFAHEYNQTIPNFHSWHKGCPRLSKESQKHLRTLKERFEKAQMDYLESTTQKF